MDPQINSTLSQVGLLLRWKGRWTLNAILYDLDPIEDRLQPFLHKLLEQVKGKVQKAVTCSEEKLRRCPLTSVQ